MDYPSGYQIPPDPAREVWSYVCAVCGEECNADEVECYGLDIVCRDCADEYAREHEGDYYEYYVAHNEQAYYMDWWLSNLPEAERQEALQEGVRNYYDRLEWINRAIGDNRLQEDRLEFARECEEYWTGLKEHLKEAG